MDRLLAISSNIRLGWKCSRRTNTLAYSARVSQKLLITMFINIFFLSLVLLQKASVLCLANFFWLLSYLRVRSTRLPLEWDTIQASTVHKFKTSLQKIDKEKHASLFSKERKLQKL
jgi:hypothetical protein